MIFNQLFKQCVEFPLTERHNKAHYSHWPGNWHRTISSILATLGLSKGTRFEYTSNFQHTHMSLNTHYFLLLCVKFLWAFVFQRDFFSSFSSIQQLPKVWLFFGCRTEVLDLYSDEKQEMVEKKILDRVFLALSREQNVPKVCVISIV